MCLIFMRERKLWVLSFGKHGYPKTLSQTNLIIFSTFTTRQTHTQHQLETARKITSVSLTNIVGLLDKYLRKRLPTFALSKYCNDTEPTYLFIHRCPGLKYPFVRLFRTATRKKKCWKKTFGAKIFCNPKMRKHCERQRFFETTLR